MTALTTKNSLLDKAEKLNRVLEKSYLELAVTLVEIVETEAYKEAGYEEFSHYYHDELNREKTTISNLLKVGRWLREKNLLAEADGVSYMKLATSINAHPDGEPNFILAAAKTNTLSELQQNNRERLFGECQEHVPVQITVCEKCKTRIHD